MPKGIEQDPPEAWPPEVKDLCFEAPASGGLLISGPSGAGKTTLLRALAGLWHKGVHMRGFFSGIKRGGESGAQPRPTDKQIFG